MKRVIQNLRPESLPAGAERLGGRDATRRAESGGDDWVELLTGETSFSFIAALQQWLPSRRWFRGKARTIDSIAMREQICVPMSGQKAFLLLFEVSYTENEPELYVLPLACAFDQKAIEVTRDWPQLILMPVLLNGQRREGVLYDAIMDKEFCRALLALTAKPRKVAGRAGDLESEPTEVLQRVRREEGLDIEPSVSKAEQSNSSIIYGSSVILKFFRRLDTGVSPELEIERFLAARDFSHSPALAGALEYHDNKGQSSTVAVLTSFIPGCHDAWEDTQVALHRFFEKVRVMPAGSRQIPSVEEARNVIFRNIRISPNPADLIGSYLVDAQTLGQRTAALHLTLAGDPSNPAFCPEPTDAAAQQSLAQSLQELTRHNFDLLHHRLKTLAPDSQALALQIFPLKTQIMHRFQQIAQQPVDALRIRTHGDYHLGQVLHHGVDFLIIDFEGEPAISVEERRVKQSVLRDIAGMIYSFFYAANAALRSFPPTPQLPNEAESMAEWARYWSVWVSVSFMRAYLETARSAPFIPADNKTFKLLLDVELLRKAIYELGYELNNRPGWSKITFQVLLDLLHPRNPL